MLIPVSKSGDRTIQHEEICHYLNKIYYMDKDVPNCIVSDAMDKCGLEYHSTDSDS